MRDKELYQQILGLQAPWVVTEVELDRESQQVVVRIDLKGPVVLGCPECEKPMPGYDTRERAWRHLDTCQFTTIIKANVPRGECQEHGVRQIRVPWGERGSQFTALFEAIVIDWLQETSRSAVARTMRLTWAEVDGIMKRAVQRGLERRKLQEVHLIGVDEKAFAKRHKYVTVVCNLEDGSVLYVGDERRTETLDAFYDSLTPAEREAIYAVAMDMWEPYFTSTREKVPEADIVFDRFHIAKHLSDAVDKVRRKENKALRADGDDRLVGTRYQWLVRPENMRPEQHRSFRELKASSLKTARAYAIKEAISGLWDYVYEGAASNFFGRWYNWAIRSRMEPIKDVARMMKRHLENIVTYVKCPITNAMSEGINSKIQWIKHTARGFRNRDSFKTAILFYCGKLQLYPHGI